MTNVRSDHDTWAAALAAADLIVGLPGTGADGKAMEMFFRRVAATGSEGFQMGSRGGRPDEEPIHRVAIKEDFYLGTFVVTQEQWAAVWPEIEGLYGKKGPWEKPPGASPSYRKGSGLLPVERVSWYDAMAFCDWLTRHHPIVGGKCPPDGDWRFCLPTESEWEYACRGGREGVGRDTEYWNGDGEAALREVGWFGDNSGRRTHPVTEPVVPGSVEVHPLGLFGLHGNVFELCHDELNGGAYRGHVNGDGDQAVEHRSEVLRALASGGPASLTAPLLPVDRGRVIRGGSFYETAGWGRSAFRHWLRPVDRIDYLGFRVCLVRGPAAEPLPAGGGAALGKRDAEAEQAHLDKAGVARLPSGGAVSRREVLARQQGAEPRMSLYSYFEKMGDAGWVAAREAADVIVALPGTGEDGKAVEMFFRQIAATGRDGFRMGSRDGYPSEEPIHRVMIEEEFFLGTFVVTQEQWAWVWPEIEGLYGKKGPWKKPPGEYPSSNKGSGLLPVDEVSWYDAMAFCDGLTRHQRIVGGKCPPVGDWRFCLPTESEWEYACRGGREGLGRDTEYWNGDGEAALREVRWFRGEKLRVTQALIRGSVEDHPLGLFGLHGPEWEWCHDEWDDFAYRGRVDGDGDPAVGHRSHVLRALASGGPAALKAPLVPGNRYRVVRGGGDYRRAGECRSASRNSYRPHERFVGASFRVCLVRGPAALSAQTCGGVSTGKPGAEGKLAEQDKAGGARPPSGAAG